MTEGRMADQIHIEELEVFSRVGVTENERAAPQRLIFTITVWPTVSFDDLDDDISRTVNYSAIAAMAREFAREQSYKLIETLSRQLASRLLKEFPVNRVRIELRKFVLPEAKHVSVTLVREAEN